MTKTTYPADAAGACCLLDDALAIVESASIRTWANSAHNRPLLEGEALARIKVGRTDATNLAIGIVCLAIGL